MVTAGEGPKLGDAFGRALSDRHADRPGAILVERDDGLLKVDASDYLSGWSEQDTWALERAPGRMLDRGAGAGRASRVLKERGRRAVSDQTDRPPAVESL